MIGDHSIEHISHRVGPRRTDELGNLHSGRTVSDPYFDHRLPGAVEDAPVAAQHDSAVAAGRLSVM